MPNLVWPELVVQHGSQQIVQSGPASVSPQQAIFSEDHFAGHALVVGVHQKGSVAFTGEAFGNSNSIGGLGYATFQVDEQKDGHAG
jgi:hypothetical protein